MKESEAVECIAFYRVLWPHADLSDFAVKIWVEQLVDLDVPAVMRAMKTHAAQGGYPPNVVQLRADVLSAGQMEPFEAWRVVLDEVTRIGTYDQPDFGNHPEIERAVRAIGWRDICMSNIEEPWMQRQFEKVYGSIAGRTRTNLALEPGFNEDFDRLAASITKGLPDGNGDC